MDNSVLLLTTVGIAFGSLMILELILDLFNRFSKAVTSIGRCIKYMDNMDDDKDMHGVYHKTAPHIDKMAYIKYADSISDSMFDIKKAEQDDSTSCPPFNKPVIPR